MSPLEGMRLPCELPVVQAPMAGGPSTPALTAAVVEAGGFGFIAAGYLTATDLQQAIAATHALTGAPFGVNLFVPGEPGDTAEVAAYGLALRGEADRLHIALGEPRWDDDGYDAKLQVIESSGVHTASFTFGCPSAATVERLHRAGIQVAVTVTSPIEATLAAGVGADLLAVQGTEAGGHQGSFASLSPNRRPLLSLISEIRSSTELPLMGSGGIMTGRDAAAVLGAGAVAVQVGTALLCTPEAGTAAPYRQALLTKRYPETIVTRAYSGRFGRGLANRFALDHDGQAPQAYPEVHHLTRPLPRSRYQGRRRQCAQSLGWHGLATRAP